MGPTFEKKAQLESNPRPSLRVWWGSRLPRSDSHLACVVYGTELTTNYATMTIDYEPQLYLIRIVRFHWNTEPGND